MAGRFLWEVTKKSFTIGLVGITISDRYVTCIGVQDFSKYPSPSSFRESLNDDHLLVIKSRWENYKYTYGDVVLYRWPNDDRTRVVSRVTALPGDTMTIPESKQTVVVPEGYCWVEGGYRNSSPNRGGFALMPMGLIEGRATHIVWPPNRMGPIEKTIPEIEVLAL
ncbi:hypothetical protein ACHQM5_014065 [Ranunculus cassubicifolius]